LDTSPGCIDFRLCWCNAAEGLYLLIARIGTAYYFAHFLIILPILGKVEKTLPLPMSISEPILGGSLNAEPARSTENSQKL